MLCVCDTSGSMTWMGGNSTVKPIDVAISLSIYCAERIGGDFKNHYISFSSRPQFIEIEGTDFVDKVERIYETNLCDNTDLEKVFDLLKAASLKAKPEDRLDTIVVISDMQIDAMSNWRNEYQVETGMEKIRKDWEMWGLKLPRLVYWNVNASKPVVLDKDNGVSYVSGCSPVLFESILSGKTGWNLCLDKLLSDRYSKVII
jgi:hypothetical protein